MDATDIASDTTESLSSCGSVSDGQEAVHGCAANNCSRNDQEDSDIEVVAEIRT